MSVRLQDIAQHVGLSVSTVSLALRDAPQVAEETRLRVRDAAVQLGYVQRPRQAPRTEVAQIAFIMRLDPNNAFYSAVLSGAESECRQCEVALHYTQLKELTPRVLAQYAEADGLLVVGSIDEASVLRLRELGRPMVLIDNNLAHLGLDRVLIENVGSIYRAVAWLASLGHQQIACLSGPQDHPSFRDRLLGYRMAVADLGLRPIEVACMGPSLVSGAGKALQERLATHDGLGFSALLACNDEAAIGALHALQDSGLQVPGDVSVLGFDDIDMARVVRPALTTCQVPRELLGALGVRRLLERANDPDAPPLALVVDTQLSEGGSVGSPSWQR